MQITHLAPVLLASGLSVALASMTSPRPVRSVADPNDPSTVEPDRTIDPERGQNGLFVPNLGQWEHAARFVHRIGPLTMFLERRGWVLDVAASHASGVALRMTFEGDDSTPELAGEARIEGHHDYFLGADQRRWRTGVPLYRSVRYVGLYPGIDLRVRCADDVPEYDLLLQPGADLSAVEVHVEGAQGMHIGRNRSLVVETELGPLAQSVPKTWQVGADGVKHEVPCDFRLLGDGRFGFAAPAWDGDTCLTIDPGLIWSTFLGEGGSGCSAISTDASGVVTVAGESVSTNFPTTLGVYQRTSGGGPNDAFVSRLDPLKVGVNQLLYSTYLGGLGQEEAGDIHVDAGGVVTIVGTTTSANFPTTSGAYDTTHNGPQSTYPRDVFVSQLDPRKSGSAQLVYSTFLGGADRDWGRTVHVDGGGFVTVGGSTTSKNFPTTTGAFDTTFNGAVVGIELGDGFVSRIDPSRKGSAQLVYSSYLGGTRSESIENLDIDPQGIVVVQGNTTSTDFPTTSKAYDTTHNGMNDVFIGRLLPTAAGSAGLLYSTFLGGTYDDKALAFALDPSGNPAVSGLTRSANYPTTGNAYDRTYLITWGSAFFTSMDLKATGSSQVRYSTFFSGKGTAIPRGLDIDAAGIVTIGGYVSGGFPTTPDAFARVSSGSFDGFALRLDPSRVGAAQLLHSTLIGGSMSDLAEAMCVDASGIVTLAGTGLSNDYPTTPGAFDRVGNVQNWYGPGFLSRLEMGIDFWADQHEIELKTGGTQSWHVNAGKQHAGQTYWIVGSASGTRPGIPLGKITVPLNYDPFLDLSIANHNSKIWTKSKGVLDADGRATASFNVPATAGLPSFTLHHAYVVFDNSGNAVKASQAVPVSMR